MEQKMAQCVIGEDYHKRIVNHIEAARFARTAIFDRRKSQDFRDEAKQINQKHGSRRKTPAKKLLPGTSPTAVSESRKS